ncbi:hypothetical protein B4902_00710 [Yersinia frederiksenii]|uniref:transcriptional regulator n=1 Tax=Yersinia frederiksenii TaxID=29484 RepID=UPI000B48B181|nr:helix-turn-helix transcriptional regulator [Yersinia frederiksenii]OWF74679.1 hypothetical protein B4902_00710 [Yersinia frederiksenii]HEC1651080.1 helix-turn-helix domain-containing protein [Yersinia enterocolitica]HEI6964573.1 helix-turn-helix domain-containing protein [Yersinia enterocolitica]
MNTQTKRKIAGIASQTEIARRMEVSPQSVSLWFSGSGAVPPRNIISLCAALNWAITPHEIDHHIYPNPTDGIPSELQSNASAA